MKRLTSKDVRHNIFVSFAMTTKLSKQKKRTKHSWADSPEIFGPFHLHLLALPGTKRVGRGLIESTSKSNGYRRMSWFSHACVDKFTTRKKKKTPRAAGEERNYQTNTCSFFCHSGDTRISSAQFLESNSLRLFFSTSCFHCHRSKSPGCLRIWSTTVTVTVSEVWEYEPFYKSLTRFQSRLYILSKRLRAPTWQQILKRVVLCGLNGAIFVPSKKTHSKQVRTHVPYGHNM